MKRELIARLRVPRTDTKTRTGTAYPIGDGLLLTAHHVIDFAERANSGEVIIEWPQLEERETECRCVIEVSQLKYKRLTGYDIAVIECSFPAAVREHNDTSVNILATAEVQPRLGWKALGYPAINKFELDEATGKFGIDGAAALRLPLDDDIDKKYAEDAEVETGWGGMSGAPVFNIQTGKLQAVITKDIKWREKHLEGASVAWLLANNPEFRDLVGLPACDGHQQFFRERCKPFLQVSKQNTPLYMVLQNAFGGENCTSVDDLLVNVVDELCLNPIQCLERIRSAITPLVREQPEEKGHVKCFFFLMLGIHASGRVAVNSGNLHQLAAKTRAVVEIELSAGYQISPDLVEKKGINMPEVIGRYAIGDEGFKEVGWMPEANADMLVKVAGVATQKTSGKTFGVEPQFILDELEREDLNATLRKRRKGDLPQLIRFEVMMRDAKDDRHPLMSDEVCKMLQSNEYLPDLPVVRFGLEQASNEGELRAEIREFFRVLEESK